MSYLFDDLKNYISSFIPTHSPSSPRLVLQWGNALRRDTFLAAAAHSHYAAAAAAAQAATDDAAAAAAATAAAEAAGDGGGVGGGVEDDATTTPQPQLPPLSEIPVQATFQVTYMIGWAPHESQQRPDRRGSAKRSLTEIGASQTLDEKQKASQASQASPAPDQRTKSGTSHGCGRVR